MKDSLITKQPRTSQDFKTKLDIFAYRNNFEFEGVLLKQAFMDNYGELISMYDNLKENYISMTVELKEVTEERNKIISDKGRLEKVHQTTFLYKEQLECLVYSLTEEFYKVSDSFKSVETAIMSFVDFENIQIGGGQLKLDQKKANLGDRKLEKKARDSEDSVKLERVEASSMEGQNKESKKDESSKLSLKAGGGGMKVGDQNLDQGGKIGNNEIDNESIIHSVENGSSHSLIHDQDPHVQDLIKQISNNDNNGMVEGVKEGSGLNRMNDFMLNTVKEKQEHLGEALKKMFRTIEDISNHICNFDSFIFEINSQN